jgi:hypothetical protein
MRGAGTMNVMMGNLRVVDGRRWGSYGVGVGSDETEEDMCEDRTGCNQTVCRYLLLLSSRLRGIKLGLILL